MLRFSTVFAVVFRRTPWLAIARDMQPDAFYGPTLLFMRILASVGLTKIRYDL